MRRAPQRLVERRERRLRFPLAAERDGKVVVRREVSRVDRERPAHRALNQVRAVRALAEVCKKGPSLLGNALRAGHNFGDGDRVFEATELGKRKGPEQGRVGVVVVAAQQVFRAGQRFRVLALARKAAP